MNDTKTTQKKRHIKDTLRKRTGNIKCTTYKTRIKETEGNIKETSYNINEKETNATHKRNGLYKKHKSSAQSTTNKRIINETLMNRTSKIE